MQCEGCGVAWRVKRVESHRRAAPEVRYLCAPCRGEGDEWKEAVTFSRAPKSPIGRDYRKGRKSCRGCRSYPVSSGNVCSNCKKKLQSWAINLPNTLPGPTTATGRALLLIDATVIKKWKRGDILLKLRKDLKKNRRG